MKMCEYALLFHPSAITKRRPAKASHLPSRHFYPVDKFPVPGIQSCGMAQKLKSIWITFHAILCLYTASSFLFMHMYYPRCSLLSCSIYAVSSLFLCEWLCCAIVYSRFVYLFNHCFFRKCFCFHSRYYVCTQYQNSSVHIGKSCNSCNIVVELMHFDSYS